MNRFYCWTTCLAVAITVGATPDRAVAAFPVLFEEDFESLPLGDSVNERVSTGVVTRVATDPDSNPIPGVWSSTGPAGWTVNNDLVTYDGMPTVTGAGVPGQGVADYGVDEWEGWNFARLDFWSDVAGDQDRSMFGSTTSAAGTAAIADPDEYFDLGGPSDATHGGYFSSALQTPSFSIASGGIYALGFDSSWRPEAFDDSAPGGIENLNNQAVEIIVNYDNGTSETLTQWNSDPASPLFRPNAQDEHFPADGSNLVFAAPDDATSATLTFAIANAGNDWWWALDNIELNDLVGDVTVLSENFEGVALGDSVNERLAAGSTVTVPKDAVNTIAGVDYPTSAVPNAFTHTPPDGWTVDNTGTPSVGNDDVGVFEWQQWSFAFKEFWNAVAGQGRGEFINAQGTIAVADGDEWDDLGNPEAGGPLTTFLQTPAIDVSGMSPDGRLLIEFDSSWRPEDGQVAVLTALVDGSPVELLRWESQDGDPAFFKEANFNERVALEFDPAGAAEVALQFSYEGTDDWWWAIDNVRVSAVPEPASMVLTVLAVGGVVGTIRRRGLPTRR